MTWTCFRLLWPRWSSQTCPGQYSRHVCTCASSSLHLYWLTSLENWHQAVCVALQPTSNRWIIAVSCRPRINIRLSTPGHSVVHFTVSSVSSESALSSSTSFLYICTHMSVEDDCLSSLLRDVRLPCTLHSPDLGMGVKLAWTLQTWGVLRT